MKKILMAIILLTAFTSIAGKPYTMIGKVMYRIAQIDPDANNNLNKQNNTPGHECYSANPSSQGYCERLAQQKIDDTLKSLEANPAGAKYAQFVKDNGTRIIWGITKDCDGANFCSTGHKIIMNRDWADESPELLSGYLAHEIVHQMTPASQGSSLYEEYRAYEAEDQVREAYKDNKGFALQKSGYQALNRDLNINPYNATELEGWFKQYGLYDAYKHLPDYPPGFQYITKN